MKLRIATLSKLVLSIAVAAGLLNAGANASAQNILNVTVPFGFTVDNHNLDAGTYEIRFPTSSLMSLHNLDTNRTMTFIVRQDLGKAVVESGRIVFHRNGGRSYLSQIWMAGTRTHIQTATGDKLERELARDKPAAHSEVELALR